MNAHLFVCGVSIAILTACTAYPGTNQPTETQGAEIEYPHIKRPNLVVADLSRSLVIYRDILQLSASEISTSSADSYSYPVFNIPRGTVIRGVTLHEPGEQRVLALTEIAMLELPTPSGVPHMSATVIGVTDIEDKFEKLISLGLTATEPKFAKGIDFDFVERAFVDFDGHLVVLYEVAPDTSR